MKNLFCKNLKILRREHKLRQEDLAQILHVSKPAVSAWELGRNQPSFDKLIEIADYFQLTIDQLIKED